LKYWRYATSLRNARLRVQEGVLTTAVKLNAIR